MEYDLQSLSDMLDGFVPGKDKKVPQFQAPQMTMPKKSEGIAGYGGTALKLGGTIADLFGQPEIGIPMQAAGGALSGGSGGGGVTGALTGAVKSAGPAAATTGIGAMGDFLKSPINDPMEGFSSTGNAYTIPGMRTSPLSTFGSTGNPLTVPASQQALFGGS